MKILQLISSPRGEASYSTRLSNTIVEQLMSSHPGSTVKVHNLTAKPFPHLEEVHLTSFFTPMENRSPELQQAVRHSDDAIAELMDADCIVIGVPMYNFSIHSTLKAWTDHVLRAGITFSYGAEGPEGLVKNKKVYLAISTGGVYSDGPMKQHDFTEPYLRTILNFIGITDITAYRVEGLSIPELQDTAWNKATQSIRL